MQCNSATRVDVNCGKIVSVGIILLGFVRVDLHGED